jgi:hypothetical protein
MRNRGQKPEVRSRSGAAGWLALLAVSALAVPAGSEDFAALCSDRAATERVYYQHRLGDKPPFEKTMPPTLVERLVRQELHKEAVLKKVYGVEITSAQIQAEVQRINATTRAPDVLAELKVALGNDTNRFARTVAQPIVVERILRDKFDNDDALHAAQRQQAENLRTELLAARRDHAGPDKLLRLFKQLGSNQVGETMWQLRKPPDESPDDINEQMEAQKRFGPNAQILASPHDAGGAPKFYFDDLPPELQQVLRVQLRQPGDISAVIETPGGFLLYLCTAKNAVALSAGTLSIPKRSYEQWLAEQAKPNL